MTVISAPDLVKIRTQPHSSRMMMSIYKPKVVLSAILPDGGDNRGLFSFEYTLVSGNYADVKNGMTMYVGTTPGGKELGTIRVRTATSTTIVACENAHIFWANGAYLTIVDFFQMWPVFPRYTQVGETVTFWKDYDIAHTNQNTILGTFICMGPHHAACLGPGDEVDVYYTSAGTENVKGESLSYLWTFEGGTPATSTDAVPGNVTYDTPGHYITSLRTTSTGGAVDYSYRCVSIYDQAFKGTQYPILDWGFVSPPAGSRSEGGYTASVWVRENVEDVVDGAVVVLFSDDYYGTNHESFGGNAMGRSTIFMVGYIQGGSIEYNYRDSRVEFEIASPAIRMKEMETYAIQTNRSSNPTSWYEVLNQTGKRAIYSYLRWNSTVLLTNDFDWAIEDKYIYSFQSDRTSLYDAVQQFVKNTFVADFGCDRQGRMYCETSPAAITGSSTAYSTIQIVDKHDWMGSLSIEEVMTQPLGYLEMGGTQSNSSLAEEDVPFLAGAPGLVSDYRGSADQRQGLALNSQDELNVLVGNVFAYDNARYPQVSLTMAGNYRHFDIFPVEAVKLVVAETDNDRGIVWNAKPFHITDMSWNYNPKTEFLYPQVTLHELTQGIPGETIVIPPEPPDDDDDPSNDPPVSPPVPVPPTITGSSVVGNHLFWYQMLNLYGNKPQILQIPDGTNTSADVVLGTTHLMGQNPYFFSPFTTTGFGDYHPDYVVRLVSGVRYLDIAAPKYNSYAPLPGVIKVSPTLVQIGNYVTGPQMCLIADKVVLVLWHKTSTDTILCTKVDWTSGVAVSSTLFEQARVIGGKTLELLDFLVPIVVNGVVRYVCWGASADEGAPDYNAEYHLFTYDITLDALDSQSFTSSQPTTSLRWATRSCPQVVNGWIVLFIEEEVTTEGPSSSILIAWKPSTSVLREKEFSVLDYFSPTSNCSGIDSFANKVWFGLEYLTAGDSHNLMWVYPDANVAELEPWYKNEAESVVAKSVDQMSYAPDALYGIYADGVVFNVNTPGTEICTLTGYDPNDVHQAISHFVDTEQNRIWMLDDQNLKGTMLAGGIPNVRTIPTTIYVNADPPVNTFIVTAVELIGDRFVILKHYFGGDLSLQSSYTVYA